jgi:hypothetical protein
VLLLQALQGVGGETARTGIVLWGASEHVHYRPALRPLTLVLRRSVLPVCRGLQLLTQLGIFSTRLCILTL